MTMQEHFFDGTGRAALAGFCVRVSTRWNKIWQELSAYCQPDKYNMATSSLRPRYVGAEKARTVRIMFFVPFSHDFSNVRLS